MGLIFEMVQAAAPLSSLAHDTFVLPALSIELPPTLEKWAALIRWTVAVADPPTNMGQMVIEFDSGLERKPYPGGLNHLNSVAIKRIQRQALPVGRCSNETHNCFDSGGVCNLATRWLLAVLA